MWNVSNWKSNFDDSVIGEDDNITSSACNGSNGLRGCVLPLYNETGKYSIFSIVNWFLNKKPMSHLKLQKLCYYAQAWNYTKNNFKLISTDFEAWIHGPVSVELYEQLHKFGFHTIKLNKQYISDIDDVDVSVLEDVWDTYGDKTATALEVLTHSERPWIEARHGCGKGERCRNIINPQTMVEYYSSIMIK